MAARSVVGPGPGGIFDGGHGGTDAGGGEGGDERGEPARPGNGVMAEKDQVGATSAGDADVAPGGKPHVAVLGDHLDFELAQHGERFVVGGTIDHDHLGWSGRIGEKRLEDRAHQPRRVVGHHDHAGGRQCLDQRLVKGFRRRAGGRWSPSGRRSERCRCRWCF